METEKTENMSFLKAIIIGIVVVALVIVFMIIADFLGLKDPWIAFLALTLWAVMGMKMDSAPSVFVGSAMGLLAAMLVGFLVPAWGTPGTIIVLLLIVLLTALTIRKWLSLFVNLPLLLFLTVGNAPIVQAHGEHIKYLENLALGAMCFWILPWVVLKLKSKWGSRIERAGDTSEAGGIRASTRYRVPTGHC